MGAGQLKKPGQPPSESLNSAHHTPPPSVYADFIGKIMHPLHSFGKHPILEV
jgi:hypothetical protein